MGNALWEPGTAVDELAQFIQADPEDRWSRLALAENYRRMGRFDDVESALAPLPASDRDAMAIRVCSRWTDIRTTRPRRSSSPARPMIPIWPASEAAWRWPGRHADRSPLLSHRPGRYARYRDSLFGLSNALTMQGDEKTAAPFRETVKKSSCSIASSSRPLTRRSVASPS